MRATLSVWSRLQDEGDEDGDYPHDVCGHYRSFMHDAES